MIYSLTFNKDSNQTVLGYAIITAELNNSFSILEYKQFKDKLLIEDRNEEISTLVGPYSRSFHMNHLRVKNN